MEKKRAYRAAAVKSVSLEQVVRSRDGQAVTVGTDVAKEEFSVVARWEDGTFERPWRVKNPGEVRPLVGLPKGLAGPKRGERAEGRPSPEAEPGRPAPQKRFQLAS